PGPATTPARGSGTAPSPPLRCSRWGARRRCANSCAGTPATRPPTARCRAASTGAAPTASPSTTAPEPSCTPWRSTTATPTTWASCTTCGRTCWGPSTTWRPCGNRAWATTSGARQGGVPCHPARLDQPRGLRGVPRPLLLGRLLRAPGPEGRGRYGPGGRRRDAYRQARGPARRVPRGALRLDPPDHRAARDRLPPGLGRARRLRPDVDH